MITEKIKDYPDLRKVNKGFIVNNNRDEYLRAIARIKKDKEQSALKEKVDALEHKMDLILQLLQNKN